MRSVGQAEGDQETPNGEIMREALERSHLVAVNTHCRAGHTYVSASGDRSRVDYVITTRGQFGQTDAIVLRGKGQLIWETTVAPSGTRKCFLDHYPVALRWRRRDAIKGVWCRGKEGAKVRWDRAEVERDLREGNGTVAEAVEEAEKEPRQRGDGCTWDEIEDELTRALETKFPRKKKRERYDDGTVEKPIVELVEARDGERAARKKGKGGGDQGEAGAGGGGRR